MVYYKHTIPKSATSLRRDLAGIADRSGPILANLLRAPNAIVILDASNLAWQSYRASHDEHVTRGKPLKSNPSSFH